MLKHTRKRFSNAIEFLRYVLSKKLLRVICAFEFDRVKAQLKF